jgi:hypothetical protein
MVDGIAAARLLRSWDTCQHGQCLHYVWLAYKAQGARASRNFPTALDGWHGSGGKHEGDRNPPAGFPVWWGKKPSSAAGDVVISLGDGRVVATDFPNFGTIRETTLDERQDQIRRPYLGWTDTILGAPINVPEVAALIPKEKNMSYSIVPLAASDEIHVVSLLTGTSIRISSPFHVHLLQRVKRNDDNDEMLRAELDIVRGYMTAINPPSNVVVNAQAIADALAGITQDVGDAATNQRVNEALTENSTIVTNPGDEGLNNRL